METNFEPGGPHDALERDLYEGEGTGQETESDRSSQDGRRRSVGTPPSSPPGSPRPDFAPRGPVTPMFKSKIPRGLALNVGLAQGVSKIAESVRLKELQGAYKNAINSVAHAKQARGFIEELSFLIVASSLLEDNPPFGPANAAPLPTEAPPAVEIKDPSTINPWTTNGVAAAGGLGFAIAGLIRFFVVGGSFILSVQRLAVASVAVGLIAWALRTHLRREQASRTYEIALSELRSFLQSSTDFDSMASSALSFIFEVELIARGYRLSLPLPPLTRIERNDKGDLKSQRLRHSLNQYFQDIIEVYYQTAQEIRDFASQKQLKEYDELFKCDKEKIHEYMVTFVNLSTEDAQMTGQLREILQLSREARKMFLITLMSLEKTGSRTELAQYSTALQGIQKCLKATRKAYINLQTVLVKDGEFGTGRDRNSRKSLSPTSPRHLKWKHQIDKVGGMNMSIRTIQAKMFSLLEESKKTLDTADDVSELGQMFMDRYESIGKDIEDLMDAWKSGKDNLGKSITKNERRISSMSLIMSPALDKSMEAVLEETGEGDGGVASAWDSLTGGEAHPDGMSPPTPDLQPQVMETFEAIATPRPRSMMTRAERIKQSQEDRKVREEQRASAMQRGHVMGELRDVLKSRGLHNVVDTSQNGGTSSILAPGPLPSPKGVGPRMSRVVSMPFP